METASEKRKLQTVIPRERILIFSGRSHPELAQKIASELGLTLGRVKLSTFANGEIYCRFEESVRGADVFVVQTIYDKVNDYLMELLVMIDALKRASAERITAVIPHYGYARQDKKTLSREPITAKLIADLLTTAGVQRVVVMDLHAAQIQGFFDCPVDHLTALPVILNYFKEKFGDELKNWVVCSPDVGRVKMAKKAADILGADLAVLHKSRPEHNVARIAEVVGDVKDKNVLIIDDMIDTGGTIVSGVEALKKSGAKKVYVASTHGLFSGPAKERLVNADIEEVVVTDTVPFYEKMTVEKVTVVSVASIFAQTLKNIHEDVSVSDLFQGLDHA
jgi:ribose-phosphate pyrophosphokinase